MPVLFFGWVREWGAEGLPDFLPWDRWDFSGGEAESPCRFAVRAAVLYCRIGAFAMIRLVSMVVISWMVREERVLGELFRMRGGWPSAYHPWFKGNAVVVGPMMLLFSSCSVPAVGVSK